MDNNIYEIRSFVPNDNHEVVPDWIVNQMINSFAKVIKEPTKGNVRAFTHAVKTFELWDCDDQTS